MYVLEIYVYETGARYAYKYKMTTTKKISHKRARHVSITAAISLRGELSINQAIFGNNDLEMSNNSSTTHFLVQRGLVSLISTQSQIVLSTFLVFGFSSFSSSTYKYISNITFEFHYQIVLPAQQIVIHCDTDSHMFRRYYTQLPYFRAPTTNIPSRW